MSKKCKPRPKPTPWLERFWRKVQKSDLCWLWTGNKLPTGYGIMQVVRGKNSYAHRLSWELANGRSIPAGMFVIHSCDVPSCVRPDHLRIGTAKDNAADAKARGRLAHPDKTRHPGETNGRAKLSAAQVAEIRSKYWAAPRKVRVRRGTVSALAAEYGVSTVIIDGIAHGRLWADAALTPAQ